MASQAMASLGIPDTPQRSTGKTPPPPAPSAAFAKRAREIKEGELGTSSASPLKSAYRPPALRGISQSAMPSNEEDTPSTATPPQDFSASKIDSGYRRARAGTLPSDFLGAGQRYVPPGGRESPNHHAPSRSNTSTPIDPGLSSVGRPGLRHANSSVAALSASSENAANRLRSGSLTLPQGHLQTAFGNSAFSQAWLANPGLSSSGGVKSGLSQLAAGIDLNQMEELTSVTSNEGHELGNFSTLDYLGLEAAADTPRQANFFQPASMSEMRQQAQQAIANNGPSSRIRATTMSNYARPGKLSSSYSDLIAAASNEHGQLGDGNFSIYDQHTPGDLYGSSYANYGNTRGFKDEGLLSALANRPRATTIADPPRRAGSLRGSSAFQSGLGGGAPQGLLPAMQLGGQTSYRNSAPRHAMSSSISSRTSTPDVRERESSGDSKSGQTPTRSLWLGNLDVSTSVNELMSVFQGYGPIESIRVLPEKSCSFINFLRIEDAIKARDDVLIRMGGHIPALSDTPIRVGYGKETAFVDNVPTAAPTASTMQYSLSNSSLSSLASSTSEKDLKDLSSPAHKSSSKKAATSSAPQEALFDETDKTETPSRALWVGSIPSNTTPGTLMSIFSPFGAIESARVLTQKQCGFLNFEQLSSAVAAKTALNGREILGSEVGAVKVGYARIPQVGKVAGTVEGNGNSGVSTGIAGTMTPSSSANNLDFLSALKNLKGSNHYVSSEQQLANVENYRSSLVLDLLGRGLVDDVKQIKEASVKASSDAGSSVMERLSEAGISEQQMIMMVLSQGEETLAQDVLSVAEPERPALYYSYIPAMGERSQQPRFDAVGLKEIRRRLDGGLCDQDEINNITSDLLDDCVDLASDYIGNTIVQKLFEQASPELRLAMLDRIAPHLALIGTHKNGTWAAQKIIECSKTTEELSLIAQNLQPYCPPLCADQFGNYVVSICLRFGPPYNAFIFDAMVDRCWDVAQTRFGARCMRTCLESPHTTPFQRKRIATAIILHSIPLATNPNGALLLTWLVDASDLPGRYSLLAPRFAPYMSHLATHKLASLTILRIINQKVEPEATTTILDAIFRSANDQVLQEILTDQVHGCHTIAKIICGNTLSPDVKPEYLECTKRVLQGMRVSSSFAYKKLLEECGLPVTSAMSTPARYSSNNRSPPSSGRSGYSTSGVSNHSPYRPPPPLYMQNSGYMPVGPTPQELAMNQMMNSMQAFQLGQGMAQGGLSPLLIPQHSFGQVMGGSPVPPPMSPTPTLGSFNTPHANIMSPNSDPFNPFASPTQVNANRPNMRFDTPNRNEAPPFNLSPSFGGLGMQPEMPGPSIGGYGGYGGFNPMYRASPQKSAGRYN